MVTSRGLRVVSVVLAFGLIASGASAGTIIDVDDDAPLGGGGTNWFSPSFSPRTELFYVMAFDSEAEYYIRDDIYEEGRTFTGGGSQSTGPMAHSTSAVRAIDPRTGARRWE